MSTSHERARGRCDYIRIEGLSKHFGDGGGGVLALKDIDCSIEQGSFVTIVGPSGCGKSTLLKSICGLEPLSGGRILIDGKDAASIRAHQRVGLGVAMSPEGRGVFADQTVRENLMLGGYSRRNDPAATQAAIEREFKRFPRLRERQDQLSGTLSGGEQQMLAIGRALMSRPRLIMLDEPSLGLAPNIVERTFDIIRSIRDTGTTVLLVEQNAFAALQMCDHAYLLEGGRVVLSGAGADLIENEHVRRAYLGG